MVARPAICLVFFLIYICRKSNSAYLYRIAGPAKRGAFTAGSYTGGTSCELFAACAGNFAGMNQMLFRKEV
jgi:hypothetical protein